MKNTTRLRLPLNRVEGDLEIQLEITDGRVTEAWSVGTMYRGFENLLKDRALMDGLVITPRICGICSTAHLMAAAKALDAIFKVQVPDNGKRIRNVSMMVEQLQNDIRHTFLLFTPDLAKAVYDHLPLYPEAVQRYRMLQGEAVVQTIRETKKLMEIIAILGGQWPHSSFMVPGGVVSVANTNEINQCRSLLANFRRWYEQQILGCSLKRWQAIQSPAELEQWLQESDAHRNSELGFLLRFGRAAGLADIGGGHGNFLSFGGLEMPVETEVVPLADGHTFFPSGFASKGTSHPFDQTQIAEDISFSRFEGYTGGRHPFDGVTLPKAQEDVGPHTSWCKAPRYAGQPAETGALAELIVASNPLFTGILDSEGPSVLTRQIARLIRPTLILPAIDLWLKEISTSIGGFYRDAEPPETGQGFGLTQAHRGALGHWVKIENRKIALYQVITPTAWNASPRDADGIRGPLEQALIGAPVVDADDPIEVEHVVRSFDPCLVCTVHAIETDGKAIPVNAVRKNP